MDRKGPAKQGVKGWTAGSHDKLSGQGLFGNARSLEHDTEIRFREAFVGHDKRFFLVVGHGKRYNGNRE
jgi:hypothetical protein